MAFVHRPSVRYWFGSDASVLELPTSTIALSMTGGTPSISYYAFPVEFGFETYSLNDTLSEQLANITYPSLTGTTLTTTWLQIGTTNSTLRIVQNGTNRDIVISQGFAYNPFYIAYYISQQIRTYGLWCEFLNGKFVIYSKTSSDTLSIGSVTNSAATALGMTSAQFTAGSSTSNTFSGTVTLNGTYSGVDQCSYWVTVSGNSIYTATANSSNYYKGTISVAGRYKYASSTSYTVTVDASGGAMAEKGKISRPTFSVTSTGSDSTPTNCELLYYDTWYAIGDKGVKIKFSEYPFKTGDSFVIDCLAPQTADGTNATASLGAVKVVVYSSDGTGSNTATALVDGVLTLAKGLSLTFGSGTFNVGDTFTLHCFGPTFRNIYDSDIGAVSEGNQGDYYGFRLIAKEGAHRISWAKVGLKSHDFANYGYGKTEIAIGLLGAVSPKNTKELISSSTPVIAETEFSSFYQVIDINEYLDIGTGNPIYATDSVYSTVTCGDNELTQLVTSMFTVYFGYK